MKKSILLTVLSLSMLLVACGNHDTSSTKNPSNTSSDSVTNNDSTDSKDVIDNNDVSSDTTSNDDVTSEEEITIEQREEEFLEVFNKIFGKDKVFQYDETSKDTYNLHSISTNEELWGVSEDNYSHSSEYISKIGYDGKNHLCYAVQSEKYIDGDYESEDEYNYSLKKEGDVYNYYASSGQYYYTVDEYYAYYDSVIYTFIGEIISEGGAIFDLSYNGNAIMISNLLYDIPKNVLEALNIKSTFDVSYLEEDGIKTICYSIGLESNYVAPEVKPDNITQANPYISLGECTAFNSVSFSWNKDGIVDITSKFSFDANINYQTDYADVKYDKTEEYENIITNIESKYTDITDLGNIEDYEYSGLASSYVNINIPTVDGIWYKLDSSYGEMGGSFDITELDEIISDEAKEAGVTYKIYEDKELKKEVDPSTIKFISCNQDFYIDYVVPKDKVLVIEFDSGRTLSDIENANGYNYRYGFGYVFKVVSPSDNWIPSPYTINPGTEWSHTFYSDYFTIDATSDDSLSEYIDLNSAKLKAGNWYFISNYASELEA